MKKFGPAVLQVTAALAGLLLLGAAPVRAASDPAADVATLDEVTDLAPVASVSAAAPAGARVRERVFPQALGGEMILFDNGPIVTHPGGGGGSADASRLQDSSLSLTIFGFGHAISSGFRVADDFEVTDAQGWDVTTVSFFAYQTGSTTTSTIDNVNLRIWDGPPDDPGSTIVFGDTTTNRLSTSTHGNVLRDLESGPGDTSRPIMENSVTVGIHLDPGVYWLDWQTGGTLGSGPWAVPISIVGQAVTGDALQFNPNTPAWAVALDGVNPQGMPFVVYGILDEMPFLADFEEGDFSEWTASQP